MQIPIQAKLKDGQVRPGPEDHPVCSEWPCCCQQCSQGCCHVVPVNCSSLFRCGVCAIRTAGGSRGAAGLAREAGGVTAVVQPCSLAAMAMPTGQSRWASMYDALHACVAQPAGIQQTHHALPGRRECSVEVVEHVGPLRAHCFLLSLVAHCMFILYGTAKLDCNSTFCRGNSQCDMLAAHSIAEPAACRHEGLVMVLQPH
jgi:hypothetical protein